MKQRDEAEVIVHYNLMRNLNPNLPEWDDTPEHMKEMHRETYDSLIAPILKRIDDTVKKGKIKSNS